MRSGLSRAADLRRSIAPGLRSPPLVVFAAANVEEAHQVVQGFGLSG
jgi:hypothetical protein